MNPKTVPCYDIFELALPGLSAGNPFTEFSFSAEISCRARALEVDGFYNGNGTYRLRCMPDEPGRWGYVTKSNLPELDGVKGTFECVPPRPRVHGPLRVASTFHFAYADGRRYFPIGTTCYAWIHQDEALQEQTLRTLAASPFNKLRMCVFPKDYTFSKNEPSDYPFVKGEAGFDFSRFDPAFWQRLEKRIGQLADLGIEADLILFHPYDRWGFSKMGPENDDRYLRYAVARLGAYHNIWWSLANEYNIITSKSEADWERFFRLIQACDPYQHLRSIHNLVWLEKHDTRLFYDFGKPWVTHCSIQHAHTDLAGDWRELYRKPVVVDEACYEGNVPDGWGNLTAQEMVLRFWEATVQGAYCGHGETYLDPQDVLWWSKGGVLKGGSPARIAFLRKILEEIPDGWIDPLGEITNSCQPSGGQPGRYLLHYFGVRQPATVTFRLPPEGEFRADVIDTWEMTVTPVGATFHQWATIALPGRPYLAVRLVRMP